MSLPQRLRRALTRFTAPPPGWCVLCDDRAPPGLDLCHPCRAALPWNDGGCARCALPRPARGLGTGARLCGACAAQAAASHARGATALARIVAPWRYEAPLAEMVRRIKFDGALPEARVLSELLAEHLAASYTREALPALILPVPLHWRRLAGRGHNQSALIARVLGARLGLPVAYRLALRRRHTAAQSGLGRAERQRNLTAAFALRRPLPAARIAVVDDVLTTGATLRAMVRCLRAAGAREIHAWLLARTPRPDTPRVTRRGT